jgi:hypothetical protein
MRDTSPRCDAVYNSPITGQDFVCNKATGHAGAHGDGVASWSGHAERVATLSREAVESAFVAFVAGLEELRRVRGPTTERIEAAEGAELLAATRVLLAAARHNLVRFSRQVPGRNDHEPKAVADQLLHLANDITRAQLRMEADAARAAAAPKDASSASGKSVT